MEEKYNPAGNILLGIVIWYCLLLMASGVKSCTQDPPPEKVCVNYKTEQYVDTSFNVGIWWFTGIPSVSSETVTSEVCTEWVLEVPKTK